MGWVKDGSTKLGSHRVVPFLLGAALPTVLLFLLASDRVGEHLSSSVSGWSNGATPGPAPASHDQHEVERFPGLADLLPKVATEDRTVIITSVNEAWARPGSLLDLYLESFKNGENTSHLLDHLLVVALDPAGFRRSVAMHPNCYLLEVTVANLTSATRFMSKQYLELVWTKLELQQRVLELGYNFLFTDADMIVLRNPFRRIPVYADMSVSSDDFSAARAHPLDNPLNTGVYYVKATSRGVRMLKYWRAARGRFPGAHDQTVFGNIKQELVAKLGVTIEPLDTVYFGGFCEYHDDFSSSCTMHADCCIGVDNKVHDLRDIAADWTRYRGMAPEERKRVGGNMTWTVPARCRRSVNWRKPVHP
ncbi:hypothetical protein ZWY2020_027493 [Hordeum vulgare]|nr:hypothetical protein ZWY2020_027493 [Hordeum vulgare]